jgi:hypothetical protein
MAFNPEPLEPSPYVHIRTYSFLPKIRCNIILRLLLDVSINIFTTNLYVTFSHSPCLLHVMKCTSRYMEIPYNMVFYSF